MESFHDSKTVEKNGRNKNMKYNKALTTIDPFRDFSQLFANNLFDEVFPEMKTLTRNSMRSDYYMEDGNITINVDVAGATSDDVSVNLSKAQKCVVVTMAKQYEKKESKPAFYLRERTISDQKRIFSLPENFDYESMEATVKNGLLTIKGKTIKHTNESSVIIKVKSED